MGSAREGRRKQRRGERDGKGDQSSGRGMKGKGQRPAKNEDDNGKQTPQEEGR